MSDERMNIVGGQVAFGKILTAMVVGAILCAGGAGWASAQETSEEGEAAQESIREAAQEAARGRQLTRERPVQEQRSGGRRQNKAATARFSESDRLSTRRPPALEAQYRRALTAWRTESSLLEAKARLDRVLRKLPGDLEARKLRADVLLEMGRSEKALLDARRASELDPEDGEARLLYAEAARKSGKLDLARRELEAAGDRISDDAALHARLSWNALLLDELVQAEAFARVALALDPDLEAAYYQLARVFVEKGQRDQAAMVLARGLRASVLRPAAIREDETLRDLADHEAVRRFMR